MSKNLKDNNGFYGIIHESAKIYKSGEYNYVDLYDNQVEFEEASEIWGEEAYSKRLSHNEFIHELAKLYDLSGSVSIFTSIVDGFYAEEVEEYRRCHPNKILVDENKLKVSNAIHKLYEWENKNRSFRFAERFTMKDVHTGIIELVPQYITSFAPDKTRLCGIDVIDLADYIDKGCIENVYSRYMMLG